MKACDDLPVGIISPVHNYDLPSIVKDFIRDFDFSRTAYVFGIITHGGDKGNAILSLKKLLQEKGNDLAYHSDFLMPVNSRIMYGMVTNKIDERIAAAQEKVNRIVEDIDHREVNAQKVSKKHLLAMMHNLTETKTVRTFFTPEVEPDLCTACGICLQVCPVDNISMKEDQAFIQDSCVQCMTCMHWCPDVAIHYGKRKIRKEQQYHHPDIRVRDMCELTK